jgi:BolA protein
MQTRSDRLRATLTAAFNPLELEVVDESAHHAGHAGASAAGETHYRIGLVSAAFEGQSRVARSRAVYQSLGEEFSSGLHALSLTLRSPRERTVNSE